MSTIRELAYDGQGKIKSPWRADLQPARFRRAYFHVEANGIESGRRIVVHEFPKKNLPYSEDMGRRAFEFTVRGYCIQYPHDIDPNEYAESTMGSQLYRHDYRIARDLLADELNSGEPGTLYLPTMKGREVIVICPRYRLTEEDRSGGYCTFDMTFTELGAPPRQPAPDNRDEVLKYYEAMRDRNVDILTKGVSQPATPSNGNGTDV